MATTVHLPDDLLKRVDERARAEKVSRNQYVRRALARMVEQDTEWSAEFLRALDEAASDEQGRDAVDEMMRGISRRSRKGPPPL
jgi:predicted transcriptional regulator